MHHLTELVVDNLKFGSKCKVTFYTYTLLTLQIDAYFSLKQNSQAFGHHLL